MSNNVVQIYTDGACSGNPGPGGFGVIIKTPAGAGALTYEYSVGYGWTTNNRMELLGVIFALEQVKDGATVEVTSDSNYVVKAINEGWLENWQRRGWKTAGNQPVKNADLWKRYLEAANGKRVSFVWVKGHNANKDNERCDELAVKAYSDHGRSELLEDGAYLVEYGLEPECMLRDETIKEMLRRNEFDRRQMRDLKQGLKQMGREYLLDEVRK